MNDINYNLKRHVELLKRKEKFRSQNKSFFKENRAESLELSKYSAAVSQHIFWEDRKVFYPPYTLNVSILK